MKYLLILLFFSASVLSATDNTTADALLQQQRLQFQQAEQALKKNNHSAFQASLKSLENYPLYPYLIYQDLKQKVSRSPQKVSLKHLEQFEHRFPDFPYHSTLRKSWLSEMAHHKHWAEFVKGYPTESKETSLKCQYLYGQYHLTHDASYLDKAKAIWLSGKNQPPECDRLFKALHHAQKITPALTWERIALALKGKNTQLVTHLAKTLSADQRKIVSLWEKGLKNPGLIGDPTWRNQINKTPTVKSALLSQVLLRLAKQDAEAAHHWFKAHEKEIPFTPEETIALYQGIAMYLAHQRSPLAIAWMEQLPADAIDRPLQEWRVRLSILAENYQDVLLEIQKLPEPLQQEDHWQYWKARSLEKLGKATEAQILYEPLAKNRSYYGLLASQRLQQPFNLNHRPIVVASHELAAIEAKPAIQRFREFQALQRPANARVEWFRAVDKMTPQERTAAAKIVEQLGLADMALQTLLKSSHKDDMEVRFPLAHQKEVQSHAKTHQLDPAWIYALIRQESAFHEEAHSPVGARGLMQIMPETGKELAKSLKAPYSDETDLFKAPLNIRLGTAYMKQLTTQMHNHPILATAAYNAGPSRAKKWLTDKPMDPEIWIETIPFRETRDYVKNVLTFTAIYQQRLKAQPKIPVWMGVIPGK